MSKRSKLFKIVVFASGRGSNFNSIVKACNSKFIEGKVVGLITNNKNAGCVKLAKDYTIPVEVITYRNFTTKEKYVSYLLNKLNELNPDLIALAGYVKKIPDKVVERFENKIINIHPALLPSFGGKNFYGSFVHKKVYEVGTKVTGVTVHIVDKLYDHGPIIYQEPVKLTGFENYEQIAYKVLQREHIIYPNVIRWFSKSLIKVENNRVILIGNPEIIEKIY